MTDHEKENLREELLELEGMLLQCREKADKIQDAYRDLNEMADAMGRAHDEQES